MDFDGLEDTLAGGWRQFISNGEGPITKNDNAFELCSEFIENGDEFFKIVSKYDDILSDVFQRPNYKAGDTLKLVLPFLRACGVTDSNMLEFSRKNILTVPGAKKTMRFVQEFMTPFIVATSYEHYITAVCDAIGFPLENTYCTALDMDSVKMDPSEGDILKKYAHEISRMSLMHIPEGAKTIEDFSRQDQETIRRLDAIFWEELTDMSTYQFVLEVNPVGGEEKASAVLDIRRRTGIGLEDTMYVGDSITDVQAFQLVREGGGLSVSFNGNEYALREAEVAVISDNTVVTSVLAETFHKAGMEGINNLVDDWSMSSLKRAGVANEYLLKEFEKVFPHNLPTVARVTPKNMKSLVRQSMALRRSVRGEVVGTLG
ncbi:HAD hydrolase family protein [Methanomassiliicoccus luminyensis]|jgi:energy-converting hydrogenase A subunit R|uniref:HAD hydrolase family protein n=1 Tax=Methanomassiliicoccus luminyensis TaxID=1080712 RepID=UPI0003661736|nr:HAD hydrolase family protein [Methanomassiliicoccus luminyensis]